MAAPFINRFILQRQPDGTYDWALLLGVVTDDGFGNPKTSESPLMNSAQAAAKGFSLATVLNMAISDAISQADAAKAAAQAAVADRDAALDAVKAAQAETDAAIAQANDLVAQANAIIAANADAQAQAASVGLADAMAKPLAFATESALRAAQAKKIGWLAKVWNTVMSWFGIKPK